jgi:threonine/homoserine/homoserine lactone efflux protein
MRPIILFAIGATASLFILGYAVHMFIGGLVSRPTEIIVIALADLIGASVIGWMAWDVLRRR